MARRVAAKHWRRVMDFGFGEVVAKCVKIRSEALSKSNFVHRMAKGGVILVSDREARLKPCLRCGYSLRNIAGAKNCPECGLAVRVSLSSNTGLEWSNPRWQRFRALAYGILAFAMLCSVITFSAGWIIYGAELDYYELNGT